jgi:predicted amidohydrolase
MIDDDDTQRLCDAAARANTVIVMGCNEMDPRPAAHTIYNTLLFIGNHGEVLGRRRKMMPTFVERASGDAATVPTCSRWRPTTAASAA